MDFSKYLTIVVLFVVSQLALAQPQCDVNSPSYQDIHVANTQLIQCWNDNRLNCVVDFYAPDAVYVTSNGPIVGKANIDQNFQQRFSNKDHQIALGQLKIDFLYCQPLSKSSLIMVGQYHLKMTPASAEQVGYTTLVWSKIAGTWKIFSDSPISKAVDPEGSVIPWLDHGIQG